MDSKSSFYFAALFLVLASCKSAYSPAHVDTFAALSKIEPGKEVILSGYLFNGLETSGIYRFPDTHKSGDHCVRMSFAKVKGFKVDEEKKVAVKGILRRSNPSDLIFHACQSFYFEDFTVSDR